jgi:hypothetical protein
MTILFFPYYHILFQVTLSQSSETSSCRDILSKALNVCEYSGRVRGMGLGVTQTILNKGRKRSEKNPSTRELMAIIQNLSSEVEQLKKERGKDIASQQDMHILSDKDSSNVDVLKNIPEVFNYLYIFHLVIC